MQQLSDEEVFRIVRDGIPAQGMPSFDFLAASEIRSIVSYLRSLGGQSPQQPLRGDPARGQELFFGKAECGSCHMIRGKGGFLGADLTGYGQSHGPDEVREGILNPARFHDLRQAVLEVVTHTGERFSGFVRNEDNFSLQLLGADGVFYMLMKSDVSASNWRSSPALPEGYGKRLSSSELDDLVSYVAQTARPSPAPSRTPSGQNPHN
jgi:cytochrome c oxidase cbb3-type subunit III